MGYTQIDNEILEQFLLYKFPKNSSSAPMRIWLFVARKTWGYQKDSDNISLSQFSKATYLPRNTVVHWLTYLVKANLLVKANELSKNGLNYKINKNFVDWIPLVKANLLVKARIFTSKVALTKTSSMALTHKRKKENNTKESITRAEAPQFSSLAIKMLITTMDLTRPDGHYARDNIFYGKSLKKRLSEYYQKLGMEPGLLTDDFLLEQFRLLLTNVKADNFWSKNATSIKFIVNNFNKLINICQKW